MKLAASSPGWQRLLHYRESVWNGLRSRVQGGRFFFAPLGATDPEAELIATVEAFRTGKPRHRSGMHPQCAFPARFRYLARLFPGEWAEEPCPELHQWLTTFNAVSVTLVFAASDPHAPPSMFGHTFLRFNSLKNHSEGVSLLDYGVNFAAVMPEDAGIEMAFLGLTGGYEGHFTVLPYHLMVKSYNHTENRDMWEYDLTLNVEETRGLLLHIWEIEHNGFLDYFFLDENCSYQIMALIETARPNVALVPAHPAYLLPVETLRVLASHKELVKGVQFRPSLYRSSLEQIHSLSSGQQLKMAAVVSQDSNVTLLNDPEVVDAAATFLRYQIQTDPTHQESHAQVLHKILARRAHLPVSHPVAPNVDQQGGLRPDQSHPGRRFTLGIGRSDEGHYGEVGFKVGIHDLLNADPGYPPDHQFDVASLRVRMFANPRESGRSRPILESFEIFSLMSLAPLTAMNTKPAWQVRAAIEAEHDRSCGSCTIARLDSAIGGSMAMGEPLASSGKSRALFYGLVGGRIEFGLEQKRGTVGPELVVGFHGAMTHALKLLATERLILLPLQGDSVSELSLGLGYSISPSVDVRLVGHANQHLNRRESHRDLTVTSGWYF